MTQEEREQLRAAAARAARGGDGAASRLADSQQLVAALQVLPRLTRSPPAKRNQRIAQERNCTTCR